MSDKTAVSDAIAWSLATLRDIGFDGQAKIDVSGDGRNSDGAYPHEVRDVGVVAGVTIDGLAIVNEEPDLAAYYRRKVVGGPGSFVISTLDFVDFANAIRLKLTPRAGAWPNAAHGVPRRRLAVRMKRLYTDR